MFGLEFFAGIGGGVGLALIVWWVVDQVVRRPARPVPEPPEYVNSSWPHPV